MKTINYIKTDKISESKSLSSQTDIESLQFVGKKRYNKPNLIKKDERKSLLRKLRQDSSSSEISSKVENFFSLYEQIVKNMKKKDKISSDFFSLQQKYYFKSFLNLDFIKYFKRLIFFKENNNFLYLNLLNKLINNFMYNENDLATLSLLLEHYLFFQNLSNNEAEEYFLYLGFFTKYITSYEFSYIFNEMLKINSKFNNWYNENKNILDNIDLDIQKVNQIYISFKQNHKELKYLDYNLFIKDIIAPFSNIIEEKNPIEEINPYINTFERKSNIGKIIDVTIVYREDDDNDDKNEYEYKISNCNIENDQTNLSSFSNSI